MFSAALNMLEKKTYRVWLGQPAVVLGALEAQQRMETLEVVAVMVELQLQLLQLVEKWLWQLHQQLRGKEEGQRRTNVVSV